MNKQLTVIALLAIIFGFASCKPKFKKLSSGLEIMMVKKGNGKRSAKEGDVFSMNLVTRINDSVIFKSSDSPDGKAAKGQVQKPTFKGDPMEGIMQMKEGDSAIIRLRIDSTNMDKMPGTKLGDTLVLELRLVTLQSEKEFKDQMEKDAKEMDVKNEKGIQDFLKKNNIQAQKTGSGLYYVITQPGSGPIAQVGQEVSMKYTGQLLDGTVFDSNVDPKYQHTEPFSFVLGARKVIPGWDEGLAFLNKGAKATLVIPSSLAYGSQEVPGNPNNPKGIPANSVLIFDVEMLDIKAAKAEPQNPSAPQ